MKALLVLIVFFTLVLIGLAYKRDGNQKKLMITLGLFGLLWAFAVLGMMTRPVIYIFILHVVFVIFSWLSVIWYIFRAKYHVYLHLSPIATLSLYVLGEFLFGSGSLDLS